MPATNATDLSRRDASAPRALLHRLLLCCVCGLIALCCACEPPLPPETESFEVAEVAYRKGSYQEAIDGYESFLRHYPASPLARIARLRLRAINREVGAVLKRNDMPTPDYRERSSKGSEK